MQLNVAIGGGIPAAASLTRSAQVQMQVTGSSSAALHAPTEPVPDVTVALSPVAGATLEAQDSGRDQGRDPGRETGDNVLSPPGLRAAMAEDARSGEARADSAQPAPQPPRAAAPADDQRSPGPQSQLTRLRMSPSRALHASAIRQRNVPHAQLRRTSHQLLRRRGSAQEAKSAPSVKLTVGRFHP